MFKWIAKANRETPQPVELDRPDIARAQRILNQHAADQVQYVAIRRAQHAAMNAQIPVGNLFNQQVFNNVQPDNWGEIFNR